MPALGVSQSETTVLGASRSEKPTLGVSQSENAIYSLVSSGQKRKSKCAWNLTAVGERRKSSGGGCVPLHSEGQDVVPLAFPLWKQPLMYVWPQAHRARAVKQCFPWLRQALYFSLTWLDAILLYFEFWGRGPQNKHTKDLGLSSLLQSY